MGVQEACLKHSTSVKFTLKSIHSQINKKYLNCMTCTCNHHLSMFGCMHEFWTIPPANMMYTRLRTRLRNYTKMMVDKHGIQTFEVVIVSLLSLLLVFDIFVFTSAHSWLYLDKWFVQIYWNVSHVYYWSLWGFACQVGGLDDDMRFPYGAFHHAKSSPLGWPGRIKNQSLKKSIIFNLAI